MRSARSRRTPPRSRKHDAVPYAVPRQKDAGMNARVLATIVVLMMNATAADTKRLIARTYDSGFELAHDTYNSISAASDGRIYYVLSSESIDTGARVFSFDPATQRIETIGDLTEACGEKDLKAIPQGKSHVNFVESGS